MSLTFGLDDYYEIKDLASRLAEYETAIGHPSEQGRAELMQLANARACRMFGNAEQELDEMTPVDHRIAHLMNYTPVRR